VAEIGGATGHVLDITDPGRLRRGAGRGDRALGKLDALVNCAGVVGRTT
jgi:NAD(P)-dependent dehydrogenase (short-subunit alcohol dehydrogenase family)